MDARRLPFLLLAIVLAALALALPRSWDPLARTALGPLTFTGPLHGGDAVAGPALPVPLISQYQGLAADNSNCGPTAVASLIRYAQPDLAGADDATLVSAVRDATGGPPATPTRRTSRGR